MDVVQSPYDVDAKIRVTQASVIQALEKTGLVSSPRLGTALLGTWKNSASARAQPIEKGDARHKRDLFGKAD
jgi:hypothetical protein